MKRVGGGGETVGKQKHCKERGRPSNVRGRKKGKGHLKNERGRPSRAASLFPVERGTTRKTNRKREGRLYTGSPDIAAKKDVRPNGGKLG